jgi:hypothetical protein
MKESGTTMYDVFCECLLDFINFKKIRWFRRFVFQKLAESLAAFALKRLCFCRFPQEYLRSRGFIVSEILNGDWSNNSSQCFCSSQTAGLARFVSWICCASRSERSLIDDSSAYIDMLIWIFCSRGRLFWNGRNMHNFLNHQLFLFWSVHFWSSQKANLW